MILIIGGVYQGKLDYALANFDLTQGDVYFCNEEDTAMPQGKRIIYELDKWILALVRNDANICEQVQALIDNRSDTIIICNDISCGVVPVDAQLRKWREAVGQAMRTIAQCSDDVIRLFCGIPSKIK